jgi:hypothetical protein
MARRSGIRQNSEHCARPNSGEFGYMPTVAAIDPTSVSRAPCLREVLERPARDCDSRRGADLPALRRRRAFRRSNSACRPAARHRFAARRGAPGRTVQSGRPGAAVAVLPTGCSRKLQNCHHQQSSPRREQDRRPVAIPRSGGFQPPFDRTVHRSVD